MNTVLRLIKHKIPRIRKKLDLFTSSNILNKSAKFLLAEDYLTQEEHDFAVFAERRLNRNELKFTRLKSQP